MSDKIIAPNVKHQIPGFIQLDNPGFVAFLDAYFEWLESSYSPVSPAQIETIADLDQTLSQFVRYFRNEFISGFPEILATDPVTGGSVDPKTLIKNAKQFYRMKGSEKSFRFMFRLLYNSDIEVYLPKTDMLIASGSRWIEQRSIRTTRESNEAIFTLPGRRIRQTNLETNTVTARARVSRVVTFRENQFEVAELFLNDVSGTFEANLPIFWEDDNGETVKESSTYSCLTGISITNPGTGYVVGQSVTITGGSGSGAAAEVSRVGQNGEVLEVSITNFGANYITAPTITFPEVESGKTRATGTATIGAFLPSPGFYNSREGELSSTKRIQDSEYFQNYSYVIKSEVAISRYRDIVKNLLHPAGFSFFGSVLIKKCSEEDLEQSASLISVTLPRIGNYTPYTLEETEDLSLVWPNGYPSLGTGDVLSTPGHPRSDPYWIIFPHPNTWGVDEIPAGVSFGIIEIRDFYKRDGGYNFSC